MPVPNKPIYEHNNWWCPPDPYFSITGYQNMASPVNKNKIIDPEQKLEMVPDLSHLHQSHLLSEAIKNSLERFGGDHGEILRAVTALRAVDEGMSLDEDVDNPFTCGCGSSERSKITINDQTLILPICPKCISEESIDALPPEVRNVVFS